MKMTNKYIETRTRRLIPMANEARRQMALINKRNCRNGRNDWSPFAFGREN